MAVGVDEVGIAGRVRAARERTGLSREALAYHSGVSWSAIAQVESGRRTNLRPGTLEALAGALHVTIDYLVSGSAPRPPMLEHRALLYDDEDRFVAGAADFLAEASERSEAALAVLSPAKLEALQAALGAKAKHIEFAEDTDWYRTPADALAGYQQFLEKSIEGGASWVRILGEPVWSGSPADVTAWFRYESLLNLVFSGSPLTVLCSYARHGLDDEVLEQACATHPYTLEQGTVRPSPSFCDPGSYVLSPPTPA
jgi:transcriptional regulator with XRE-family HTH domain